MTSPLYTSHLSLPYTTPPSPHQTLDIHTPATPPLSPTYNLLYIHGGAFHDPLTTSLSLLPSLPALFNPNTNHIAQIASINYRLSPYPEHPTHPSREGDEGRNVRWPSHIEDVKCAVGWLCGEKGWRGTEWVVAGHSVGGTMGMMLGMETPEGGEWGRDFGEGMEELRGVVSIAGIHDFGMCRDNHESMRGMYDSFISGAFGPEEEGGWKRGKVMQEGRRVRRGVDVCLVVGSRGDELVEWGQAVGMVGILKGERREGVGVLVEVEGGHDELENEGMVVGRAVDVAVGVLVERERQKRGD